MSSIGLSIDVFRYFENAAFQGFVQRHGENMFTASLPDVKYNYIVSIAIYNRLDILADLSHRNNQKGWHICQSASYMT